MEPRRTRQKRRAKAKEEEVTGLLGSAIDRAQVMLLLVESLEGSPYDQAQYAENLSQIKKHAIANAVIVGKVLGHWKSDEG